MSSFWKNQASFSSSDWKAQLYNILRKVHANFENFARRKVKRFLQLCCVIDCLILPIKRKLEFITVFYPSGIFFTIPIKSNMVDLQGHFQIWALVRLTSTSHVQIPIIVNIMKELHSNPLFHSAA